MTKNPKTISRDLLASEALEILNSSKITALIVTDAGKPVGIVHLHDIPCARAWFRAWIYSLSFRGDAKHRARNLEIPGLVPSDHPGMTTRFQISPAFFKLQR